MANAAALKFCKDLFASYGKWKIPEDTRAIYAEKLSTWRLRQEQWYSALDKLQRDFEDLPALSQIYPYLKGAQSEELENKAVLLFALNGTRYALGKQTGLDKEGRPKYAIVAVDPAHLPELPEGASDAKVAIPPSQQDKRSYIPIIGSEARSAFSKGFLQAGGHPDRIVEMFSVLQRK